MEVAHDPVPDVDHIDVHVHVWLPRSALLAVRAVASSASYTSAAPGRPECSITSYWWVHERPYSVFPIVATPSDRDARGTLDDDSSNCGSYHLS
jgi:hypothetical protein